MARPTFRFWERYPQSELKLRRLPHLAQTCLQRKRTWPQGIPIAKEFVRPKRRRRNMEPNSVQRVQKPAFLELNDAPCMFTKQGKIVICHVDNLILFSENSSDFESLKAHLNGRFHIKDLEKLSQFFGIELDWRKPKQIALMNSKIIETLFRYRDMSNTKPMESMVNPTITDEDFTNSVPLFDVECNVTEELFVVWYILPQKYDLIYAS